MTDLKPEQRPPLLKRLAIWGGFLSIFALVLILLSPFPSIFQFSEGFVHKNPSQISAFVNYSALRRNLKGEFASYEQRRSRSDRSAFGFFLHPIRGAIVKVIIDNTVNPSLPDRLLGSRRRSSISSTSSSSKDSPVHYAGFSFKGVNQFSLRLRLHLPDPRMNGQILGLHFSRTSLLRWSLVNITLSDDMIHNILKKAQD
jgi:hypothetical protein